MKIKKYAIIAELFFALLLSSCQKAEDIYPEVGKGCKFTVSAIEETKAIRRFHILERERKFLAVNKSDAKSRAGHG